MSDDSKSLAIQELLTDLGQMPEDYQAWFAKLPPKVKTRVKLQQKRIKQGLHTVAPLTCLGPDKCPFLNACPLVEINDQAEPDYDPDSFPIGLQCLLESEYIAQKLADYVVSLQIDPADPVEMSLANELALLEMQKNRALLILSHGDKDGNGRDFLLVDEQITMVGDNQVINKQTKIHPLAQFMDNIERRRDKKLEQLAATRKSKNELAIKSGAATKETKLLEELNRLRVFFEQKSAGPVMLTDDEGIDLDEK